MGLRNHSLLLYLWQGLFECMSGVHFSRAVLKSCYTLDICWPTVREVVNNNLLLIFMLLCFGNWGCVQLTLFLNENYVSTISLHRNVETLKYEIQLELQCLQELPDATLKTCLKMWYLKVMTKEKNDENFKKISSTKFKFRKKGSKS